MPMSAIEKIGASPSLLMTAMVWLVCMPARCWMAPEMPLATYRLGDTVLPVWPIWWLWGIQPASVAARDAPTAPPSASASSPTRSKPSALPRPRPPETMIAASVISGRPEDSASTRSEILARVALSGRDTSRVVTSAAPPPEDSAWKLLAFTPTNWVRSPCTWQRELMSPPKMALVATIRSPSSSRSTASATTPPPTRTAQRATTSVTNGSAAYSTIDAPEASMAAASAATFGSVA